MALDATLPDISTFPSTESASEIAARLLKQQDDRKAKQKADWRAHFRFQAAGLAVIVAAMAALGMKPTNPFKEPTRSPLPMIAEDHRTLLPNPLAPNVPTTRVLNKSAQGQPPEEDVLSLVRSILPYRMGPLSAAPRDSFHDPEMLAKVGTATTHDRLEAPGTGHQQGWVASQGAYQATMAARQQAMKERAEALKNTPDVIRVNPPSS